MAQYEVIPRKYGRKIWIDIPKKVIKKEKINLKNKVNVLVSKNVGIIHQK